jgi:hypothetical protein
MAHAFSSSVDAFMMGLQGNRVQVMTQSARIAFADTQSQNRAVLGIDPPFRQFVDGRENAALRLRRRTCRGRARRRRSSGCAPNSGRISD